MGRTIQILAVLLAVQVILAASLIFSGKQTGAFVSNEKLVNLELSTIDEIAIQDNEKASVILKKQDKAWQMPDYFGFPASSSKVDSVAGSLLKVTKPWPVATTENAAKRFKVSPEEFEKKIEFKNGGKPLKTLFIGSSPGFRKVHARDSANDEVYAIEFSAFEASTKPDDWADKEYLNQDQGKITRIELPSFSLQRKDKQWQVSDLGENQETDQQEANAVVQKIANLAFQKVLGKEDKPDYNQSKPVVQYTLALNPEGETTYTFSKPKDSENFVLKTSSNEYFFEVNKMTLEGIQEIKREKLVKEKLPAESKPAAEKTDAEPAATIDTDGQK